MKKLLLGFIVVLFLSCTVNHNVRDTNNVSHIILGKDVYISHIDGERFYGVNRFGDPTIAVNPGPHTLHVYYMSTKKRSGSVKVSQNFELNKKYKIDATFTYKDGMFGIKNAFKDKVKFIINEI